jgi:D-serine deaminase-like pyridoxal phosphate-dependent protein
MHGEEVRTPALMIDLAILERNLHRVSEYCQSHNLSLRPHTKTHKTPEVARMQIDLGAVGLTVAKVGEAQVMAASDLNDILVAYPIYGRENLSRLARLARARRMTVSLDSAAVAEGVSRAAAENGASIGVLVEFDVGYGRCGLAPGSPCVQLARMIQKLPGLQFRGLMTFFGNIWGTEEERLSQTRQVARVVGQVLDAFSRERLPLEIVSGGSTPSALLAHLVPGLTEIRPGTYAYNDLNTFYQGVCQIGDCAARVVTTVVSTAVPGRAIIDAGSKTFSSDTLLSGPKTGYGYVVEFPDVTLFALDEEHGFLDITASSHRFRVGEVLTVIPNHVCTCVNMQDEVLLLRDGQLVGEWAVAGRRKMC